MGLVSIVVEGWGADIWSKYTEQTETHIWREIPLWWAWDTLGLETWRWYWHCFLQGTGSGKHFFICIEILAHSCQSKTLELIPLYSWIQPQDSSLEFSLPSDTDEAALASTSEPTFNFSLTLIVFIELKQLDLIGKFRCIRKHWVRANRALRGLGGPKAPRGLRAQGDKP